jgi:hypothetical protein
MVRGMGLAFIFWVECSSASRSRAPESAQLTAADAALRCCSPLGVSLDVAVIGDSVPIVVVVGALSVVCRFVDGVIIVIWLEFGVGADVLAPDLPEEAILSEKRLL